MHALSRYQVWSPPATPERLWALPALWFLTAVLPYPFLPAALQQAVYTLSSAGVVLALLLGVRRFRPALAMPWRLAAAAFGCMLLGDLLTGVTLSSDGGGVGLPWSGLVFYPWLIAAVVLLLRALPGRDTSAWLDAAIWMVAGATLAWESKVEVGLSGQPSVSETASLAVTTMELTLFLLLARLLIAAATRSATVLLLSAGLGIPLASGMTFVSRTMDDAVGLGVFTDLGWLTGHALVATAALHQSMAALTRSQAPRDRTHLARWRVPLLLVPAMVGPATLVGLAWTGAVVGEVDDLMVATGATVIISLLTAARGMDLIHLANIRSGDLQTRIDHDALTGLLSRDGFLERLTVDLERGPVETGRCAVVFLDLDDFKTVNDIQGHAAGDRLLIEVAARLNAAAPAGTAVARFGGDEFAMLVRADDTESAVGRALAAIGAPLLLEGRELALRASVGSVTEEPRVSAVELLRCVDVAMYEAKRSRTTWARYVPEMSTALVVARDARERLVRAVADGEVVPWFQPVVNLRTGSLVGFEALARWVEPGGPPLPADQWLPQIEQSELIVSLDRAIVRAAVAQLACWRTRFRATELHMAVNLSGTTLLHPGIEDEILEILRAATVPADRLFIEVTEGVQIKDEEVPFRLQRLRTAGVRVALDDFGTGWSSLDYLRRFPVDQLKLDRSFSAELEQGADAEAIPAAVAQLAGALGLSLVAEGVATQAQRLRLLDLGFDVGQGYLFAPALRPVAAAEWIERDALSNPVDPLVRLDR